MHIYTTSLDPRKILTVYIIIFGHCMLTKDTQKYAGFHHANMKLFYIKISVTVQVQLWEMIYQNMKTRSFLHDTSAIL